MNTQAALVEAVVRGVENFLLQQRLTMAPDRKARLVRLLFTYLAGHDEARSAIEVERLLDQYWSEVERALRREQQRAASAEALH